MSVRETAARMRPCWTRRISLVLGIAASLQTDRPARGHADFMTFIQHRVKAAVGATNIDITIELTFFEVRSLTERERMDVNHDKIVTDDEVKAYLRQIAESLHKGVGLSVAGRAVDLAPLYEPEIDLLLVKRVAPCHHVLLLYYFARTPARLAPGDEIAIEDNLWPAAEALRSFEIVGKGGFAFAAPANAGPASAASRATGPWIIRARCVAVPASATRAGGEGDPSGAHAAGTALGAVKTRMFRSPGSWAGAFSVAILMLIGAVGAIRRRRRTQEVNDHEATHTTDY